MSVPPTAEEKAAAEAKAKAKTSSSKSPAGKYHYSLYLLY
jgi:hypothetical protein